MSRGNYLKIPVVFSENHYRIVAFVTKSFPHHCAISSNDYDNDDGNDDEFRERRSFELNASPGSVPYYYWVGVQRVLPSLGLTNNEYLFVGIC